MATRKTTQKRKTTTRKTSTAKPEEVKLTYRPIASGAKELNFFLKEKKAEKDGSIVTVPMIEGLPEVLTIKQNEVITVTPAQCAALENLGFVETEAEYQKRKDFVDNLDEQHPDQLTFEQRLGLSGGQLTMKDSQYTVYMDKLIRL